MVTSSQILGCKMFDRIFGHYGIDWEIQTAISLKKKLIGVKIEKENTSPHALLNAGTTWALSFNFDAIKKAVDSA